MGGLEIVGMQEKALKLQGLCSGQKFLQASVKAWLNARRLQEAIFAKQPIRVFASGNQGVIYCVHKIICLYFYSANYLFSL